MGISTHILDTTRGKPAEGVRVTLSRLQGDGFGELASGETDADGRLRTLVPDGTSPEPGTYRIHFAVGDWFAARGVDAFYPSVEITFVVKAANEHYHVPLLLNPFGYSTYRGS
ncbi:MAG: hydroxyisourate hydrolase [Myxococcales bacterium]|nr:hydroxyisourate hydrolase [Myxococcales bacterium]